MVSLCSACRRGGKAGNRCSPTDNFATKHLVGVDNRTGTVNLGKFAEGTKIEFGI